MYVLHEFLINHATDFLFYVWLYRPRLPACHLSACSRPTTCLSTCLSAWFARDPAGDYKRLQCDKLPADERESVLFRDEDAIKISFSEDGPG